MTSTEPEDVHEPEEESNEPDESEPLLLSFTGGSEEELDCGFEPLEESSVLPEEPEEELSCGFEPLDELSVLLEEPLNPEEFSGPLEESPELLPSPLLSWLHSPVKTSTVAGKAQSFWSVNLVNSNDPGCAGQVADSSRYRTR